MTTKELLISRLNLLSEEDIVSLLDAATYMGEKHTLAVKPDCPYCGSCTVIRYGHKCRKQRFYCKSCRKTFVHTTHTIILFSTAYRNAESIIKRMINAVLTVTGTDYYHSNRDVREAGLLAI